MIQQKLFENESKWLEFRKDYVMASEIAAILGLSKYKSANQYRNEKLSGVQGSVINPVNSRRGKILENAVLEALRHDLGWHIIPNGRRIYYDDVLMYGCTPDAFLLEGFEDDQFGMYDKTAVIECKTTTTKSFENYWRKEAPLITQLVQTYVQMMLTEHAVGYLAGLTVGEYEDEDSYNLVVDVKLGLFRLTRTRFIDDLIFEGIKRYTGHIPNKRLTVPSVFSRELEASLRAITEFMGIYEGLKNNSINPLTSPK